MASTNKTENIGLNDWASEDRPERADFNSDNLILDEYIGDMSQSLEKTINQISGQVQNITLYVNGLMGDDDNVGGQLTPYKTIQAAINNIPKIGIHGYTIIVAATTTYPESIVIDGFSCREILIRGESGASFRLDGDPTISRNTSEIIFQHMNHFGIAASESFRIHDNLGTVVLRSSSCYAYSRTIMVNSSNCKFESVTSTAAEGNYGLYMAELSRAYTYESSFTASGGTGIAIRAGTILHNMANTVTTGAVSATGGSLALGF